jgi:hypothetical protein
MEKNFLYPKGIKTCEGIAGDYVLIILKKKSGSAASRK